MPDRDPTRIGRVRHVLGAEVTVALDDDLAGAAPIYRGSIQPIGQIGSMVRIPQGLVDLLAQVSLLGIAELTAPQPPTDVVQTGERWLQVQLLGEVNRATGHFQRGVASYPGLDDPVHFATAEDLSAVFPTEKSDHISLGTLSTAEAVQVDVDAAKLVTRHTAVVGSTGAGKTSTVATLLQRFCTGGWDASNIVVIDPHGEYAKALGSYAAVQSVLATGHQRLQVPFWALPADAILQVFTGSSGSASAATRARELITEGRREFGAQATWLSIDPAAVTADTPIPFDLRKVWHQLDYENNETRDVVKDPTTTRQEDPGDAETLTPAKFTPYQPGGGIPSKGPMHGTYGPLPDLLRLGLLDSRLAFLQEPAGSVSGPDPLVNVMASWLGADRPVSVLDFSGVPDVASGLAIGVILTLLFEAALRSPAAGPGVGRSRPILVVLEEAHRYLGGAAPIMARDATNKIAREGRKYGIGLMLVTQRPSELPDTALAQCGTLVALRLTNSADQAKIRAALPDNVSGLAAVLPALRTGEAVVTGEAVALPARVVVKPPDPAPAADDPSLDAWHGPASTPDLAATIDAWRGGYAN